MEALTLAIGDIIVGIDIGTSKVSSVIGEVNNFNQIEVICNNMEKFTQKINSNRQNFKKTQKNVYNF